MQVREIMTKNPACCTPDSTLQEIAQLMVEHDCGLIPVVDSNLGMRPIGTITDRDITIRTFATGKNPLNMKASEIMTTDIVTISPETSVQDCGNVMKKEDIRRVLVIDRDGKLIGIVAQADIAQYGPNPNLISDVVNEISQSAPSTHTVGPRDSGNSTFLSAGKNLLNLNYLLPILAGVGAGAAIKYYLYPAEESENRTKAKRQVSLPINRQPSTFDKMASDIKDSNSSLKQDSNPTLKVETRNDFTEKNTSSDLEDTKSTNPEIGRGVTPG